MNKRYKNIILNLFLLLVIGILLLLFHAGFIAGPRRVVEHENKVHMDAFASAHKLENPTFMNRFVLKEVYYIIEDEGTLYWFTQDMHAYGEHDYVSLSVIEDKILELGFEMDDAGYGVLDGELVFTLESNVNFVYLNMDTYEIVLEMGGS